MIKKKSSILIYCATIIMCLLIGFGVGFFADSLSPKIENDNLISQLNNTEKVLPYNFYESSFFDFDNTIIEQLNNNPIDKNFIDKYNNAKTVNDEVEIINEWSNAYERELDNAYIYLEKLIDNDEISDELKKNILIL